MDSKEKARELYDNFHQYRWDEVEGYLSDDIETKKIASKVIDEVEEQAKNWGVNSVQLYWIEVRKHLNKL